jgi:DNA-binding transcriptional regulator YdaS (Cro superfamily)
MNLRDYIYQYPRGKRMQARKIIANALNVSESAIKAWELGLRNPRPQYIAAIEMITEGKVTINAIRKNKE